MSSLTLGKYRALGRCSTADGKFAILALDHQDSLRRVLNPESPESLPLEDLISFKNDVVAIMSPLASGVLLDPVYGAPQAVARDLLAQAGLLVELERADYQSAPAPLDVEIDPDWRVAKIKRMGADGVKLFFYYNHKNDTHAAKQDAVTRQVVADCARFDLPLYAEPIFYEVEPGESKRPVVIEMARRTAQAGADILKLEFPIDAQKVQDEQVWAEACQEITESIDTPWVLLSAGVPFEVFTKQLEIACNAGASGFMVGRALWGGATTFTDSDARREWLATEGRNRLALLRSIAELYAQPWTTHYVKPLVSVDWFRQYESL